MPTDELASLRASIERFEGAITRVEELQQTTERLAAANQKLAEGNEKVLAANRRQRIIILLLVILSILSVGSAITSSVLMINLKNNTEQDAERAAILRLDGCRARNQTNVVVRNRFDSFYKALDLLAVTPGFHEFVVNLKAEDGKQGPIVDTDCTLDGTTNGDDYPADGGP